MEFNDAVRAEIIGDVRRFLRDKDATPEEVAECEELVLRGVHAIIPAIEDATKEASTDRVRAMARVITATLGAKRLETASLMAIMATGLDR